MHLQAARADHLSSKLMFMVSTQIILAGPLQDAKTVGKMNFWLGCK